MYQAKIIGTGSYLPKKVLTNKDLEKMVDTSDEWIQTRTGMKERRIASKRETTSTLAINAAKKALEAASIKPTSIDLVIVATATPDMMFPSTACIVQARLGCKNAASLDISATCSGFIYGLSIAEQYLKTGRYNNILLIGSEILSRIVDWTDRNTCVLFGDGAASAVITRVKDDGKGIISTHLYSAGKYGEYLMLPGGGSRNPISNVLLEQRLHYIKMQGNHVFKMAIKKMCDASTEALRHNNISPKEVDVFIPHQANKRIIYGVMNYLEIPLEKTVINIEKYGNTSAATIPIALDEAVRTNRIKDRDILLLVAFGGGITWGSALIRW